MAYSSDQGAIDLTFTAGEDLSDYQYRFVFLAGNDQVDLLDSGSEIAIGVLQNDPASGEAAVVRIQGVSKLVAGAGGLALNDLVTPEYVSATDNGKGVATTTNGDPINGRVIFAAGSEDDVATVILRDGFYNTGT